MKKTFIVCLAGMLLFAACTNDNSSTQGSYDADEPSTSTGKEHEEAKDEHEKAETTATIKTIPADTAKSSLSAGQDTTGAEVKP